MRAVGRRLERDMRNSIKKTCSVLMIPALLLTAIITGVSGKAYGNRHQTNKNDISNLFESEIEGRQGLDQFLENSKKQAESGIGSKAGLQELGTKESELENKTSELNSINANSLESRGQEERAKEENSYYDSLEIDYSDPKIQSHKKDIDKIADANKRLMSRLIEGLRDLDIDCKTVKGDKELEPQYVIEIEKEHFKDVTYNQHICESLRNRYNCNDSLSLNCVQWGMNWNIDKDIIINQREIEGTPHQRLGGYYWFGRAMRWGSIGEYEYRYFANNEKNLNELKSEIAKRIGLDMSQIHVPPQELIVDSLAYALDFSKSINVVDIKFAPSHLESFSYRFTYKLGTKICTQWAEDWNEVCKLQ